MQRAAAGRPGRSPAAANSGCAANSGGIRRKYLPQLGFFLPSPRRAGCAAAHGCAAPPAAGQSDTAAEATRPADAYRPYLAAYYESVEEAGRGQDDVEHRWESEERYADVIARLEAGMSALEEAGA